MTDTELNDRLKEALRRVYGRGDVFAFEKAAYSYDVVRELVKLIEEDWKPVDPVVLIVRELLAIFYNGDKQTAAAYQNGKYDEAPHFADICRVLKKQMSIQGWEIKQ